MAGCVDVVEPLQEVMAALGPLHHQAFSIAHSASSNRDLSSRSSMLEGEHWS